jgi:hypothetical protein
VTLPYAKTRHLPVGIPSNSEPVKFAVNLAGPPAKPKYSLMTDSGLLPRRKVDNDPERGVKKYLKPCAYKPSEPFGVTACLLKNEPAS